MFACIFAAGLAPDEHNKLLDFASRFSPLVEETAFDCAIVDLSGSELLNGPFEKFHSHAATLALEIGLKSVVTVASNPDAAFHAAHGWRKSAFIPQGKERECLNDLPLIILNARIAAIPEERLHSILKTLHNWGIDRFGQLATLPTAGIAERFGSEGIRMRQLAAGESVRSIRVRTAEPVYSRSINFDHPVHLREPLIFALFGLLNELHRALESAGLAVLSMHLSMKLAGNSAYNKVIEFPTAIKDIKILQKIIDLELSNSPPQASVLEMALLIQPGRFQAIQAGLFVPGSPQPEKTELVLARIEKMAGKGMVGSPEVENSHRPDAFRMKRFDPSKRREKGKTQGSEVHENPLALRMLRPPLKASVWINQRKPTRIHAQGSGIRNGISGVVICAAGPWKTSGEWWSEQKYQREEWDLELSDGSLCRIYRDLLKGQWFVDGIYD